MKRNLGLSWPFGGRYRNQLPTRQLLHSPYLTGVYTKHVASTDTDLSNKLSRTILSGVFRFRALEETNVKSLVNVTRIYQTQLRT